MKNSDQTEVWTKIAKLLVSYVEGNYGCAIENKMEGQVHKKSSCSSEQSSNKVRNRRKPNLFSVSVLLIHKHAPASVKSLK